jgi:hypothetical protein
MDAEAFVRWALDDARTVEERYTTELLVDHGVMLWKMKHNVRAFDPIDAIRARCRERRLNPAYDPSYSEAQLRMAAECIREQKEWSPHSDRPVRDIAVLAFMESLEVLSMVCCCHVTDLSPLTRLPRLRKLHLGAPGYDFRRFACRDFTPLARCTALRDLTLGFDAHWPDFTGFDALTQLDQLTLSGNLLALPRAISFPSVRRGAFYCQPLAARNVSELPHLPNCAFLILSGVERLDGIEQMPLRNLTLLGPFEDFGPLVPLKNLTCLTVSPRDHRDPEHMPRDVSLLARLPALRCVAFGNEVCAMDLPRDYAPLTDAPALRELIVHKCAPVEIEVAAINAALLPCDDLYAPHEPRPLPPLRIGIAPHARHPQRPEEHRDADETGIVDSGLRAHEGRWASAFLGRLISARIGHHDWGKAGADGVPRTLHIEIQSFECVDKLPLFLDLAREAMTRLRDGYVWAQVSIHLRVPPPEDTPAQKALEESFQEQRERWENEQDDRDRQMYIERLHQLELKKQEGGEVVPEEFSPSEQAPYPIPPWTIEPPDDEAGGDDDQNEGDVATKEKPQPPVRYFDDEHPLADNYRLLATLTPDEVWFLPHHRALAIQLMRREPDVELPTDEEAKA